VHAGSARSSGMIEARDLTKIYAGKELAEK
jgi:hypothetical protein